MNNSKITRILAVRDTRDRIEVGDRWVAVPGTGDLRPCDRCCREHEIHVDVELSDGRRANIGSGCAKGESMEIQARLKSAVSAAKTRSKLREELALVQDEQARAAQAWAEVEGLQAPSPALIEEIPEVHGTRQIWGMEDARVWTVPGSARGFDAERRQALLSSWLGRRYYHRGWAIAAGSAASTCSPTATSVVWKILPSGSRRLKASSKAIIMGHA